MSETQRVSALVKSSERKEKENMLKYLLVMTSVLTLILNILLTLYVVRNRLPAFFISEHTDEVINFVLKPDDNSEPDTQLLETEILSFGDASYGRE